MCSFHLLFKHDFVLSGVTGLFYLESLQDRDFLDSLTPLSIAPSV
jgi:hypothetical protein